MMFFTFTGTAKKRKPESRMVRVACAVAAILLGMDSRAALAQDELFVTNRSANSVTVYARTANGNVAPLRAIVGAATGLSTPQGLAVDTVNNELAVANLVGAGSVTVYARTADGNVAPLRTIVGAATGLSTPSFLAITTAAAPPTPTPTATPTPTPTTTSPTPTPTSTPTPVGPTATPTPTPPPGSVAVPTLSPSALAFLAIALACLGFLVVRRNL